MKKRFAFKRYFEGRELLITAQRGEDLDTRRAKWLAEAHDVHLLRFGYDEARGVAVLHYDVGGLVSLKTFLKRSILDDATFVRLMVSVQAVLDLCSAYHIPTELILFDPQDVFVDSDVQPRFAVTPLDNVSFTLANSPLTMLRALGNPRRLSFASPSTEMLSSMLESFVLNQNNVFSANAFRAFLRNQCGIEGGGGAAARRTPVRTVHTSGDDSRVVNTTELRMWDGVGGWKRTDEEHKTPQIRCVLERISTGETYPIAPNSRINVGRGSRNEVQVIGNPKLSRAHAILVLGNDSLTLVDLESANGTWVNGRRLRPNVQVRIPVGQRFSLANEDFVVKIG